MKAAQDHVRRREGGIIWHTQGIGKSLTMVWLAKWIREHVTDARVLIITDRTELDEQIEKVFKGVKEEIYPHEERCRPVTTLNAATPWLICSLDPQVWRQGRRRSNRDVEAYVEELKRHFRQDSRPKAIFTYSWMSATAPNRATCTRP